MAGHFVSQATPRIVFEYRPRHHNCSGLQSFEQPSQRSVAPAVSGREEKAMADARNPSVEILA